MKFHAAKTRCNICTFKNEFVTPKDHLKLVIYILIYTLSLLCIKYPSRNINKGCTFQTKANKFVKRLVPKSYNRVVL